MRIAHQLDDKELDRLLPHLPDGVEMVKCDPDNPWTMPDGARGLIVGGIAWGLNPDTPRPAGWPQQLEWVQFRSTGVDRYPGWMFEVAHPMTVRGAQADPIAEFVFSAMLEVAHPVTPRVAGNRDEWTKTESPGLFGRTLGLFGFGNIGAAIARRAQTFGMRVLASRRSDAPMPEGVTRADLPTLMAESDHLVFAAPLTDDTRHALNAETLKLAKPGLHLINIGRGGLIDEDALKVAMDAGAIARATLDVTEPEPPVEGSWLYSHPRVVLTPHVSWYTPLSRSQGEEIVRHNLALFAQGRGDEMLGRVDRAAGY